MKKTLVPLAMLGCIGSANAQSSITLYGIIDNGIGWVSNEATKIGATGHSAFKALTSLGSGDRWGLTGSEDLGGGLRAIFTLENGFNAQSGLASQGGRMFGRQAFVGLSSDRFGTLTLGRQYDFGFEYVAPMTGWLQFGSIYGAHVGDSDNLLATFRLNNTVKYQSVNYNGLVLGGLYSFSNAAGGFAQNDAFGFGARYSSGPLSLAAAYLHLRNPSSGQSTNPTGAVGGEYTAGASSIFYNAGFVTKDEILTAAAGYKFGSTLVDFVFSNVRLRYLDGTRLRLNNYEVNASYYFTPAFFAGVGYTYTDGEGDGGMSINQYATGNRPRWHQVDLGAVYLLSKRTDVHASVIWQRSAGDASVSVLTLNTGVAGAGQNKQIGVNFGLRHRF
ncbi:porin [Burkholderia cepacia]|uniref:porin n=1 Tax=Burkholderia cepacia TaxID=292 RepID=UPI00158CF03A|nr:porin [Burkholderia cepacia]